ncbi:hypothetical protein BDB01DRAFT_721915 [Pilobolus umbonatus]|nr:hypothetical protein BDB01DRAFT_721915 [Pilobolus umbonatus]
MSTVAQNNMGPVRPADEEAKAVFRAIKDEVVAQLNREDNIHDLHRMDDLKLIDTYILVEYATEEVAYGVNYFGKIDLGEGKCIHVR